MLGNDHLSPAPLGFTCGATPPATRTFPGHPEPLHSGTAGSAPDRLRHGQAPSPQLTLWLRYWGAPPVQGRELTIQRNPRPSLRSPGWDLGRGGWGPLGFPGLKRQ